MDKELNNLIDHILKLPSIDLKIDSINTIKKALHDISPFNKEPVDCVIWVKQEQVQANDYNPNSVAPPEMRLLKTSIEQDGYTQPVVTWQKEEHKLEVVDGFHRNRVAKEDLEINARIHGYLPVTIINSDRTDLGDRMTSTIRHNRARGKHSVDSMSDIVVELKKRNWSDEKIAKNLGMDADEIVRLCQISGLAELFADKEFSQSWDIGDLDSVEETLELID
jgi:ParB-like chromosome segregation protein Spo0J